VRIFENYDRAALQSQGPCRDAAQAKAQLAAKDG
jgi:hypothetical protein